MTLAARPPIVSYLRCNKRLSRWVKPELIAEVEFRRWPEGGMLQQAAFKGLRFDKDPRDVVKEYRACIPEPKGSTRRGGAR